MLLCVCVFLEWNVFHSVQTQGWGAMEAYSLHRRAQLEKPSLCTFILKCASDRDSARFAPWQKMKLTATTTNRRYPTQSQSVHCEPTCVVSKPIVSMCYKKCEGEKIVCFEKKITKKWECTPLSLSAHTLRYIQLPSYVFMFLLPFNSCRNCGGFIPKYIYMWEPRSSCE